ncbi:MAG: type II toxin-antitoxin system HicA family toxin [Lamprobacter sp.]|uniref:type II toxin-antitoxin system HicA family toxin n=1 Tax=Lamprobacter sp. TaxID=3100796 RepID=UPI002B25F651|nr:type II toxin-antitoxin system HicA family toxin [Lamprobacter sp.]MEA3644157.1 type II toxin-antitoxin system HicA family toxin [Lamprobacter sp.]
MSRWPPLTCPEVKRALKALGFQPTPGRGSSHEQWERRTEGRLYKVTVDCPKAPFSFDLIDSMARQAGTTREGLYRAADKRKKWRWLW